MIRSIQNRPILNFVSLLILNILLLSIQVRKTSGQTFLKSWTLAALSPVFSGSSYFLNRGFRLWDDYVNLAGTHKQNLRLQQENSSLRMDLRRLQELDRLHSQLEEYRRFQLQFEYPGKFGRVIAKSAPFWRHSCLLNIGSDNGVYANDAVITPLGIVGRIVNVTASTGEVELLTNNNAGAGVQVGEMRVQGIAQGNGSDAIIVKYISNQEQVRPGDIVLTSGTDRIYPPGLPVGRVVTARNSAQLFKEIIIRPAVNLAVLQEVLVLTGYRPTSAAREQEAGGRKQEAGSRRQEAGSRRQEAGSSKQEADGGRRK